MHVAAVRDVRAEQRCCGLAFHPVELVCGGRGDVSSFDSRLIDRERGARLPRSPSYTPQPYLPLPHLPICVLLYNTTRREPLICRQSNGENACVKFPLPFHPTGVFYIDKWAPSIGPETSSVFFIASHHLLCSLFSLYLVLRAMHPARSGRCRSRSRSLRLCEFLYLRILVSFLMLVLVLVLVFVLVTCTRCVSFLPSFLPSDPLLLQTDIRDAAIEEKEKRNKKRKKKGRKKGKSSRIPFF